MTPSQILNLLEEYYINGGTDSDLSVVIDHLQVMGSISYFYWITKQWEEKLKNNKNINQNTFQTLMIKWFMESLELDFSKV